MTWSKEKNDKYFGEVKNVTRTVLFWQKKNNNMVNVKERHGYG